MTTYAGIRDGWVTQTFTPLPEWEHLDPADLFARDLFDAWVPIDGLDPQPAYGWKYADGTFTPPEPLVDAGNMRAAMLARYARPP
jgi:hypothetical protein